MSTFQGVDHAGIGVADMDVAFDYWMHKLGFTEVFFDHLTYFIYATENGCHWILHLPYLGSCYAA